MTKVLNFPNDRPFVFLDFKRSQRVDPSVYCRRPSSATFIGSEGEFRTVGSESSRIDYIPITGECLGLIIEPTGINLLTDSVELNGWDKRGGVVTPIVDPTGHLTHSHVSTEVESARGLLKSVSSFSAGDITLSINVRPTGENTRYFQLAVGTALSAAGRVNFDLIDGIITANSSGNPADILPLGNGIFTISATFTLPTDLPGNTGFILFVAETATIERWPPSTTNPHSFEFGHPQTEYGSKRSSYIASGAGTQGVRAEEDYGVDIGDSSVGTVLVKYRKEGWKHTTELPEKYLRLDKSIDDKVTPIDDHIERVLVYSNVLSQAEIDRIKADGS